MNSIVISDGQQSITLLPEIEFSITPVRIGSSSVTSNGRTVLDIIGYQKRLNIPTGWLSASDVTSLTEMIKTSPVLSVSYPVTGGKESGYFVFELPELRAFKYDSNGVAQWYGVTLEAVSQEVD